MFNYIKSLFKKTEPPVLKVWIDRQITEEGEMPATFEEAVNFVAERIGTTTVSHPFFHNTGGMSVRNSLGLWNQDSLLYRHMQSRFGLCHADDTGALITSAAHARKNGLLYDPEPDIAHFKAHWRAAGYDPATMERISG